MAFLTGDVVERKSGVSSIRIVSRRISVPRQRGAGSIVICAEAGDQGSRAIVIVGVGRSSRSVLVIELRGYQPASRIIDIDPGVSVGSAAGVLAYLRIQYLRDSAHTRCSALANVVVCILRA